MFAALVAAFALLQAFTFLPTAVGAPGDSCDKPGAGNDKKCETPAPTPPPPTPTLPPPTDTPPPPTPGPTQSPAPSPDPGDPAPEPSAGPDPTPTVNPSPSAPPSPGPGTSPKPSDSPGPTVPPTTPATPAPTSPPSSTPAVTPPPTEAPVITPPPVETQPPPPLAPEPTPLEPTQPPPPFQPQPPPVDTTGGTQPLAPVETDDPRDEDEPSAFGIPGGRDPQAPILEALSDLDDLAISVADPRPGSAFVEEEEAGHAFGLRVPLGSSIGSLAATAGKAVQEFAFPLTLAIAVLLFLLFQGELDRRDPKLAYAPVDSAKDMVSFE